jgi:hypothetical protein
VSHDLAVVAQMADHILVLRDGRMREVGTTERLLADLGDAVVSVDLLPVGSPRRDWVQTLLSDGHLVVRHPPFQPPCSQGPMTRRFVVSMLDGLHYAHELADESDLDHAALRLTQAASTFLNKPNQTLPAVQTSPKEVPAPVTIEAKEEEQVVEEVEEQPLVAQPALEVSLADSIRNFATHIDASDPAQTYKSIMNQSADLLHAERSSLLLFDEASNQLTMTAARGIPTRLSEVAPVAMGEGIAGAVMRDRLLFFVNYDQQLRNFPFLISDTTNVLTTVLPANPTAAQLAAFKELVGRRITNADHDA